MRNLPVPVSVPGRRGECEESAPGGRAIFGDFGTTIFLIEWLQSEIAKGGSLGERLQRIGAKRFRGWSERAWRKRARKRSGSVLRTAP